MENVTGIGGIFIKAKKPEVLAKLYKENLGIDFTNSYNSTFKWINENPDENV
jgi:hypothetical protein